MLITYIRSSSIGSYSWCAWKHFIESNLGFEDTPGKKAQLGSCVHKVLELLAHKKKALQDGHDTIRDAELGMDFPVGALDEHLALDEAFAHYAGQNEVHHGPWTGQDKRDCQKMLVGVLAGPYSPLANHVLAPEAFFDFALTEPWAEYSYGSPPLSGRLSLKGTMDLVLEEDKDTLHYVDWKTGKRVNWGKDGGKTEKKYEDFLDDPQMLLYHLALRRLFPTYKHVMMTVYWLKDNTPITFSFSQKDIPRTKEMLREFFEKLKKDESPDWAWDGPDSNFKCKILCSYHKRSWSEENPKVSICQHLRGELVQLGMPALIDRYADVVKLTSYGSGGGRNTRASTS